MQGIERPVHELHASVTQKGQVTIPVEIRRMLGVRPRDKVAFRVEADQVRLVRSGSVVARTAGALAGPGPRLSAQDERAAAEEAIAEEAIARTEKRTKKGTGR
jgi:antitoxin PrlF